MMIVQLQERPLNIKKKVDIHKTMITYKSSDINSFLCYLLVLMSVAISFQLCTCDLQPLSICSGNIRTFEPIPMKGPCYSYIHAGNLAVVTITQNNWFLKGQCVLQNNNQQILMTRCMSISILCLLMKRISQFHLIRGHSYVLLEQSKQPCKSGTQPRTPMTTGLM